MRPRPANTGQTPRPVCQGHGDGLRRRLPGPQRRFSPSRQTPRTRNDDCPVTCRYPNILPVMSHPLVDRLGLTQHKHWISLAITSSSNSLLSRGSAEAWDHSRGDAGKATSETALPPTFAREDGLHVSVNTVCAGNVSRCFSRTFAGVPVTVSPVGLSGGDRSVADPVVISIRP